MYEVNTFDRSDVDQVFRRRIEAEDKSLDLPCKAIEKDKVRNYDNLSESTFRANEFYKEVHTGSLYEARKDGDGLDLDGLDVDSDDDEFTFTFLNYTDRHRITKIEAYQIVGILAKNSDYLITPIQSELYHRIDSDNEPEEDWAYQAIYHGTELFLQGCVDQHPDMDIPYCKSHTPTCF